LGQILQSAVKVLLELGWQPLLLIGLLEQVKDLFLYVSDVLVGFLKDS
jgi:hypothetical protein